MILQILAAKKEEKKEESEEEDMVSTGADSADIVCCKCFIDSGLRTVRLMLFFCSPELCYYVDVVINPLNRLCLLVTQRN